MRSTLPYTLVLATVLVPMSFGFAGEQFTSEAGGFSVVLPSAPRLQEEKLAGGNAPPATQYQHVVDDPNGSILVWYQDAEHVTDTRNAIQRSRDAIVKMANGPVKEEREIVVDGYPGRYVMATIPAMNGLIRSQTVFADGRVYQINVVGTEQFVNSDTSDEVFESFRLEKQAAAP